MGAVSSIDRIIDAFPPEQQVQIRTQLAHVLEGVASQQLMPARDGRQLVAFELMTVNGAVRNMIREGKNHQIDAAIAADNTMQSMDQSILELVRSGLVDRDEALAHAVNPEWLARRMDI